MFSLWIAVLVVWLLCPIDHEWKKGVQDGKVDRQAGLERKLDANSSGQPSEAAPERHEPGSASHTKTKSRRLKTIKRKMRELHEACGNEIVLLVGADAVLKPAGAHAAGLRQQLLPQLYSAGAGPLTQWFDADVVQKSLGDSIRLWLSGEGVVLQLYDFAASLLSFLRRRQHETRSRSQASRRAAAARRHAKQCKASAFGVAALSAAVQMASAHQCPQL